MLLELVRREGIKIDEAGVGFGCRQQSGTAHAPLFQCPSQSGVCCSAQMFWWRCCKCFPFRSTTGKRKTSITNYCKMSCRQGPEIRDEISMAWVKRFVSLGEKLRVSVPGNSAC